MTGTDTPALSSTSATGVAGTSTRRNGSTQRRTTKYGTPHPGFKRDVAVLKASGMTVPAMAKTLGVGLSALKYVQSLPDVKAHVRELREAWKVTAQSEVQALAQGAWNMASTFVEQRDSKAFDNTLRGLAAMEKISASVSGEGQKVEIIGLPPPPPQAELKVLIAQLFGGSP